MILPATNCIPTGGAIGGRGGDHQLPEKWPPAAEDERERPWEGERRERKRIEYLS